MSIFDDGFEDPTSYEDQGAFSRENPLEDDGSRLINRRVLEVLDEESLEMLTNYLRDGYMLRLFSYYDLDSAILRDVRGTRFNSAAEVWNLIEAVGIMSYAGVIYFEDEGTWGYYVERDLSAG